MKAQNEFENLMNQYSTEAAQDQERQERTERRRKVVKSVTKFFFVLVFLGAGAAGWYYRAPINQQLTKLKMPSISEMKKGERQAKAEGKAVEVQKLGQKRVDEFEATIKH